MYEGMDIYDSVIDNDSSSSNWHFSMVPSVNYKENFMNQRLKLTNYQPSNRDCHT